MEFLKENKLILACAATAAVTYVAVKHGCCSKSSCCKDPETAKNSATDPDESRKIYESDNSARQYMEFHYTPSKISFCHSLQNISEAFDFPIRLGRKFDEFMPTSRTKGLDLGCATGASVFEMSKYFDAVVGIDLSNSFIRCANELKTKGTFNYFAPHQGSAVVQRTTGIPAGTYPERCTFLVGDAENVDPALGTFDGILAANLVDRVPHPRKLLASFARLLRSGGVLVVASPFTWWDAATRPEEWIGGKPGDRPTEELVKEILSEHFTLLNEKDEPFLIRDHSRRFQLSFSHCTVWRRK